MKRDQPEDFLHKLYATLRSFSHKFRNVLFRGENNYVGELVGQTLRHCSFHHMPTNIEASTFLFVLLKLNQATVGGFARTRIQAITSVSRLVSSGILREDSMLKLAFARLSEYALYSYAALDQLDLGYEDPSIRSISYTHAQFTRGIQGLGETLGTILRDTIRVKQMQENADAETIADLYFQIARGYINTPDLRIGWLRDLASFQASKQNFAEAGMCMVHAAALVADYLVSIKGNQTVDAELFMRVCPSVSEFAGDEAGVCQTEHFSESGFADAVRQAIKYFREAKCYEFATLLYKAILPLYEQMSEYATLEQLCLEQSECWAAIARENESRLFGTYFRVGFYGELYGEELDGSEWIYKEPPLTHLFDLKDRFIAFWKARLNVETVTVIDANKDVTRLDPKQCFIQITKVDPFFDDEDLATRKSFFSQQSTLRRFVIQSAFSTKSRNGAPTEDLADSYVKKQILSVKSSFPYMLKRLPVTQKREIIVTPIENSIALLIQRIAALDEQMRARDYQQLSQVLQGTVLVMVSAGPVEICHVFLGNYQAYPPERVAELRALIVRVLNTCAEALQLHRELTAQSSNNPWNLHFELLGGFAGLRAAMQTFVDAVEFSLEREERPDNSESFTETTEPDFEGSDDESERGTASSSSASLASKSNSLQVSASPRTRADSTDTLSDTSGSPVTAQRRRKGTIGKVDSPHRKRREHSPDAAAQPTVKIAAGDKRVRRSGSQGPRQLPPAPTGPAPQAPPTTTTTDAAVPPPLPPHDTPPPLPAHDTPPPLPPHDSPPPDEEEY